jgi:UDP-2,4-diacetamido-2,4,6-trideoxy-beta-L-altropyranose hydrolase
MKILIRCDSSLLIGTGHLMRCLNLAEYLSDPSVEIIFVVRELEGNVNHLLREKQFQFITIPVSSYDVKPLNQYEKFLGVPQVEEIQQFTEVLIKEKPDWVVVDHYSLGIEWEKIVRARGSKVLVIDDLFREHCCDGFLDQNFHHNHYQKLFGDYTQTRLFLGPHYALLGQQFQIEKAKKHAGRVRRILVFFGGVDLENETSRFLQLLPDLSDELVYEVIIGSKNPHTKEISNLADDNPRINLHIQTNRMAEIMATSDLFIGAGGSVTWERCFLGLPAACIAVAENQVAMSESLAKIKAHVYLGSSHMISKEKYIKQIRELIASESKREELRLKSLSLQVSSKLKELKEFIIGQSILHPL